MRILPFHRIYEVYDGTHHVCGKIEQQEDEWIFLPFDGYTPTVSESHLIATKINELNERRY